MTRAGVSRLFPTLLSASLAAHVALPFIAGRELRTEIAIDPRPPRMPMAVRLVAPPPSEAPPPAELVLTSAAGARTVETLDLAPVEFERPEREAPRAERLVAQETERASEPAPRHELLATRDESSLPEAAPPPERSEPAPVEVALEAPSADTERLSGVVDYELAVEGANPPPEYPSRAQLRRQEGTCLLVLDVTPEGSVAAVRVERGSGHALLDEAAIAAARRWRFRAVAGASGPVAYSVRKPVTFDLRD